MMDNLKDHSSDFLRSQRFDALAMGVIDFKSKSFDSFQLEKSEDEIAFVDGAIFFDLASLSKPLTNSLGFYSDPGRVDEDMLLMLNHRAGLPAWGLLPKHGWQEQIKSYSVKESATLYSDFSALRFMLEFNQRPGESLHQLAAKTWDDEVLFWKDLTSEQRTVQNGFIKGVPNFKAVHDPNAYTINELVSHAGLFGSVEGVCRTLLNFNENFDLLTSMNLELNKKHERFVNGWDTVGDPTNTLAGNGCGQLVFGHLGFTGTSIWIDPMKELGHVLLCNATRMYWYDKTELNQFRKSLGELIWSDSHF